ncbi:MAG: tetratricopeptide repeat protein, partial [Planctomycetes bacterium]|nr:tetratricopeptide repeat protein [Planctomycetota bacterium]
MIRSTFCLPFAIVCCFLLSASVRAQEPERAATPVRGSLIEDRAARKLVEAGDSRYEADEIPKALEIWKSVIERYPRSRVRFTAHMRLGNYFLERDRAYDRARLHFVSASDESNRDEDMRAEATLKMGVCFYHDRNYGKCFQVMRGVIGNFPVSQQVNQAYYYIGLGHFQLGHYSRAIAALEKVGTALDNEDDQVEKLEAGKRFFIKIEDADLAVLDPGESVNVLCKTSSGDEEIVKCFAVGRNVRVVLGSVPTRLGKPKSGNGSLEVRGGDKVQVTYTDEHTAEKKLNQRVIREVTVVGNGYVTITDGAFNETLRGVVLGKTVNVKISDPDRDISDKADQLVAVLEVYRQKTDEELEAEAAAAAAKPIDGVDGTEPPVDGVPLKEPEIDRFKLVDRVQVTFTEVKIKIELRDQKPDDTIDVEPDVPSAEEKKPSD